MSYQGKQVLITGAGGFIGSHLAETLVRAGAKVRAMVHYNARGDLGNLTTVDPDVRRQMDIVLSDVRDRSSVVAAVAGCDVVFHLAALIGIPYSYVAPQSYVDTNVQGTLNLLEACRHGDVGRLLVTSTSEVYGTAQYTPIDEEHPLHAQSPYAATKVGADQLAYSYFAAFRSPVAIIRPFNTYGPRQSLRAVIPTIIAQALAGNEIRLGSVTTVRDFLFVADNARGYLAAGEAAGVEGEVINLATGIGVTITEVVERVAAHLRRPLAIVCESGRQRPDRSEVQKLIGGADKAERLLGWRPEVSLNDGLAAVIEWIEHHRAAYGNSQYTI